MGKVKQSQNHKQEVTWKALKNIHVQPQNCNKTMNPGYVLLSKDQGNTVENTCICKKKDIISNQLEVIYYS